jgi:SET domain-containing protein
MKILPPTKIYIARSSIHGFGVFANQLIKQGEVIEETPLLDLNIKKGDSTSLMIDYRFNWPQGSGGNWDKQVLAWGYGSLYNHSENANAYWRSNLERDTFEFVANRDIQINEEIFVWYGNVDYWQDGRSNTKVI